MTDPIITLTTDFGEASPYVAAMKGVILGINPSVRLVDLSHQIPPQDVRHAAFFLAAAVPYFPADVLHVVVVDPGVGSARALLYVEVAGHRLLVPDNGCWTALLVEDTAPRKVIRLEERRFWRPTVSHTFHGRDILAPVAGQLSRGVAPDELGPAATQWVGLAFPRPQVDADSGRVTGEVVFADHFGNLITNIPAALLDERRDRTITVQVKDQVIVRRARSYADATPGELVYLVSSSDRLEVAVVQGSAADRLRATVGTPVIVSAGSDA